MILSVNWLSSILTEWHIYPYCVGCDKYNKIEILEWWLFPNLQGLIDVKVTKIALDAAELLVDPL